jgi:hypothetical protein
MKSFDSVPSEIINQRKIIARTFYEKSIGEIVEPSVRKRRLDNLEGELKGIDYNQEVQVIEVKKGTLFQQKQGEVWSYYRGFYFSEVGADALEVGISPTGNVSLGSPNEFKGIKFISEFRKRGGKSIIEINQYIEGLSDETAINTFLNQVNKENARISLEVAIELSVKKALENAKKKKGQSLTPTEIKTLMDSETERIKNLPKIMRGLEIRKAAKVFAAKEDLEILVSTAKDTVDTWSIANKSVPVKGGALQYYTSKPEQFRLEIMSLEDYQKLVNTHPEMSPPKPSESQKIHSQSSSIPKF